MTVYRKNISINVGETFSEDLTLLSADGTGVVDLTGFTGQSQLRKHPSNPRFADIVSPCSDVILEQPQHFNFLLCDDNSTPQFKPVSYTHLTLPTKA